MPERDKPGRQVLAALEGWLDARSAPGNGAANPNAEPEPEKVDPCRLTLPQRERLAVVLQLDAKSLREAGLSVEVAEQAVSGQDLNPATVGQLTTFLGFPQFDNRENSSMISK